jgi:hypothetical protein
MTRARRAHQASLAWLGPSWLSYPPQQSAAISRGNATVQPDPSGTRYAITSFTVNNAAASTVTVRLAAFAQNSAPANCSSVTVPDDSAAGPEVTVAAGTTVEVTFPTPFITPKVSGTSVWLAGGGNGLAGVKWSAAGYRLAP